MKNILLGVGVLVIIVGVFFAGKLLDNDSSSDDKPEKATADASQVGNEAQYHEMERFIISVSDDKNARYLVLDLVLVMPPSVDNKEYAEQATPLLRNVLVKQFANKGHGEVKELFKSIDLVQKTLLDEFNTALANKSALRLDNVLITNVFIQ